MKIRRYYPKGFTGKTYSDEYIEILRKKGVEVDLIDTAKIELILTKEEQRVWFDACIKNILENTRQVLYELEYLPEFKVNWESYKRKK